MTHNDNRVLAAGSIDFKWDVPALLAELIAARTVVEAARDYYLDTDGENKCDPWTGTCECSAARLGRALGRDEK